MIKLYFMKKIKSPWYGVLWIVIWTAGLVWFLSSGMFNARESIGLVLVWIVLVGITTYILIQHFRLAPKTPKNAAPVPIRAARTPGRNEPCPCGSGKKYKRCCAANP